jgi:hypothetical protein
VISKNKITLVRGLFDFLVRNANLTDYDLKVKFSVRPGTSHHVVPEQEVCFELVKSSILFKTQVWSIKWNEDFNQHVALPDEFCNVSVQALQKRKFLDACKIANDQEIKHAEQKRQASLFNENGGNK